MNVKQDFDFRQGIVLEPEVSDFPLLKKAPFIDEGTDPIDPSRYYSPKFMAREWDKMWSRIWNFAGFSSDIPDIGDYFTYDLGPESFLIVRTGEGSVEAYYNVCQHRGRRLVEGDFGSVADSFTCPFHGWQYGLDGSLKQVTDRETFRPEALCGDLGLKRVRCETENGMIFLTIDSSAPPLKDALGIIPEHFAPFDIPKMKVVKEVTVEWPVNWKTAADVFYEAYHVHVLHPQITGAMDDYNVQIDLYDKGVSRFLVAFGRISPRWLDQESLNDDLKGMLSVAGLDDADFTGNLSSVRSAIASAMRSKFEAKGHDCSSYHDSQLVDSWNYGIFPNVQIGIYPEGALVQRWRPHPTDPEKCFFDVLNLVHPELAGLSPRDAYLDWRSDVNLDKYTRPPRQILRTEEEQRSGLGLVGYQDYENIIKVQPGMRSKGYEGVVLCEQESRIRHYHTEIDRYLSVS
ncbi:aromatic ring-hydroxylating oxygenase subunit alpha [Rhizorhapis sp. SPR117]|uniref:aromatic ring-hydroxylating oxygenase subunit alpha n=1 Tax=Rhizorhapis sp. SPR117 TaxID=2912611 RepID=UPI001F356B09|nr:aromatic ring-hydroxylating dioxygenase subunit alpha [Rhizorhapis sp. SPR117]